MTRCNMLNTILWHTFRTGATPKVESGETVTVTAKEVFLAVSRQMWSILPSTISWGRNVPWRHLQRIVRLDVLKIPNAPTSHSGKRNSRMTMAAHCLEARQLLGEKMRPFCTSQGLLHVLVNFFSASSHDLQYLDAPLLGRFWWAYGMPRVYWL